MLIEIAIAKSTSRPRAPLWSRRRSEDHLAQNRVGVHGACSPPNTDPLPPYVPHCRIDASAQQRILEGYDAAQFRGAQAPGSLPRRQPSTSLLHCSILK